jgi:hypothetical protein
MPARDPDFPNYRERTALQAASLRAWATEYDLHPAGPGTIAVLLRKGWLEKLSDAARGPKFKISETGSSPAHSATTRPQSSPATITNGAASMLEE